MLFIGYPMPVWYLAVVAFLFVAPLLIGGGLTVAFAATLRPRAASRRMLLWGFVTVLGTYLSYLGWAWAISVPPLIRTPGAPLFCLILSAITGLAIILVIGRHYSRPRS